ncbi:hypothetical protein ACH5A3_21195 [Streptomyces echinatus]|uniref:hypothetical protein n=1 Tax=Streptomyces echinatus TaxID=67293 RepID=UPI0037B55D46
MQQPLNLDAIEARAATLHEYGTLTDAPLQAELDQLTGPDTEAMAAAIRHLRAELAASRATVFAQVANELEAINFHPNAKATCTDLCRLLAGRFRRKGLNEIDAATQSQPAAVEAHVVADDSDDPEHTRRP